MTWNPGLTCGVGHHASASDRPWLRPRLTNQTKETNKVLKQDILTIGPNENFGARETPVPTPTPRLGIGLFNTYQYGTRKCWNDFLAGLPDQTFQIIKNCVIAAGYDWNDFVDNTYVTNYIEPIPWTNISSNVVWKRGYPAVSHQPFKARLQKLRPDVFLSLVGPNSDCNST
jgi:hypothetical protein